MWTAPVSQDLPQKLAWSVMLLAVADAGQGAVRRGSAQEEPARLRRDRRESGITPCEHATLGRHRPGKISRQGDEGLRRLLVLGVTAFLGRLLWLWLVTTRSLAQRMPSGAVHPNMSSPQPLKGVDVPSQGLSSGGAQRGPMGRARTRSGRSGFDQIPR